ncbi:MAG: phosphoribosylglycinamide formyltransferase [Desulfovibrio sp.]|jgi:phosphoribosylglycinamide formyltransferase-1|nr:phosphoribosylglycinamide formyltransferase [Desulfovibrio sp.]
MTLQIAALASGVGTNVAAIIKRIDDGLLDAKIRVVISNQPNAPVLEKAANAGIPTYARSNADFTNREAYDRELLAVACDAGADTIVLAGYMLMLTPTFVQAYPKRILNVHPSILPSFPGRMGNEDAIRYGVRLSGSTVHFVEETMDQGPVVIQAVVPVHSTDTDTTLMPRIQAMEHRIYPQALQWLAEGRLKIEGQRVILLPAKIPNISIASFGQGPMGPWMVSPPLEEGF